MIERLAYGMCLYGGYIARTASEVLSETAVLLENFAGELAPYPVQYSGGER